MSAVFPPVPDQRISYAEDGSNEQEKRYVTHPAFRAWRAVWWISRRWVERVPVHDPYRVSLIDLGLLIDDVVRAGDCGLHPAGNLATPSLRSSCVAQWFIRRP